MLLSRCSRNCHCNSYSAFQGTLVGSATVTKDHFQVQLPAKCVFSLISGLMSPSKSCFLSQCITSTTCKENQGSSLLFSLLSQRQVNKSSLEALPPVIPRLLPSFLQDSAQTCSREAPQLNLSPPAPLCLSPPHSLSAPLYSIHSTFQFTLVWVLQGPCHLLKPSQPPSRATAQPELHPMCRAHGCLDLTQLPFSCCLSDLAPPPPPVPHFLNFRFRFSEAPVLLGLPFPSSPLFPLRTPRHSQWHLLQAPGQQRSSLWSTAFQQFLQPSRVTPVILTVKVIPTAEQLPGRLSSMLRLSSQAGNFMLFHLVCPESSSLAFLLCPRGGKERERKGKKGRKRERKKEGRKKEKKRKRSLSFIAQGKYCCLPGRSLRHQFNSRTGMK